MIPFDKLQSNQLTPAVAVETNLTAGLNALPSLEKSVIFVGAKLSAGSATDGDIHEITSTVKAAELFGYGSRLYGMIAQAFRVGPRIPIYAMSQPEGTTAAGGTAGTGKFTLSGTSATASGTATFYIGGRVYQVGIAVGDTPATFRTNARAIIDADDARYVTTTSNDSGGTHIYCDARNKGPEGNSIRIRVVVSGGDGLTITASGAKLTGGATYGTHSFANLDVQRFHIICTDSDCPTASTGILAVGIKYADDASEPLEKKWCMFIAGEGTTSSTAGALADLGTNSYRAQVAWLQNAEQPNWELAAALAAERARVIDPGESLDGYVLNGVLPPYDKKDWPSETEIEAGLKAGLTALRPRLDGTVEVVRSIVTRQTEPIAYRDHNITEISDYLDADLISQFTLKWHGKKLKSLSAAGTPKTVTPERAKQLLHERMRLWDARDYTEGAELDIKAGRTSAEVNADDPNRLDLAFPFRPIYRAHQIFILKTLTTPDLV